MTTPIPLKQQLLDTEGWLLQELGFRIVRHTYDYKAMGSSTVELESEALRLQFLRDAFQTFAQVAPLAAPHDWWELSLVLEAIHGTRPRCGGTLHDAAALFRENLTALTDAMGAPWPATRQELERRHGLRVQAAMMPRHVSLRTYLRLARLRWRKTTVFLVLAVAAALLVWIVSH